VYSDFLHPTVLASLTRFDKYLWIQPEKAMSHMRLEVEDKPKAFGMCILIIKRCSG